jgi:hypothetical protein
MRKIDGKNPSVGLTRQPGGDSASQDEQGVWRATVVYQCDWNRVFSLLPKRYVSRHPDFNNLICDGASFSRVEGGLAEITVVYAGGDATAGDFGSGDAGEVIEVDNFVQQYPIETHHDFEDVIAGTPDNAINGAQFPDGVFAGFDTYLEDGSKNIMAGVTSFDAYVQVVRRTTIAKTRPENTDVGMIDAPPVTNSDFEYVKTRASWQRVGAVYVFTEEWTSGPKDAEINYLIY